MSRYTERKVNYRAKEEEQKGRFGFEYLRDHINFKTEIPELPQKPKHRPDEKANEKRIEELQAKIQELKDKRKEKKEEIKKLNERFDVRIIDIKKDVELGKKCIEVLNDDLNDISFGISKLSTKIRNKQNKLDDTIKEVRNHVRPQKRNDKNIEKMTVRELDEEKARIEQKLTLGSLSKAEESGLNSLLIKIGRLRADTNREIVDDGPKVDSGEAIEKLNSDIEVLKADIDKLKQERGKLFDSRDEIQWKITCIRDDIKKFFAEMNDIADLQHEETKELVEESKGFKFKIYDLREEISKIEKEFQQKVNDYEYEQEKIKWIAWATKVQEQKREEWEAEKEEKRKQRLREKEKGGDKKTESKVVQGKDGKVEVKDDKREERKKINRNQKQIDNCSFLIDYCKRLFPTNEERIQAEKKAINLQEELKKGQWAKEKGVQIIQSKKQKEEEEAKPVKYQRRKEEPKEEEEAPSNKFSHDYFVQKLFDNAKIIPPTAVEELEKIIKELEDKVEYYLLHPDEGVESKFEQDKKYVDRTIKPSDGKYTKSKGGNKVINTEDFPSLS